MERALRQAIREDMRDAPNRTRTLAYLEVLYNVDWEDLQTHIPDLVRRRNGIITLEYPLDRCDYLS